MPQTEFANLVSISNSIADVLRFFKLAKTGKAHKAIQERIKIDGIDASHIPLGLDSNKGRAFRKPEKDITDILTINSSYDRKSLKQRLLREHLLSNICYM